MKQATLVGQMRDMKTLDGYEILSHDQNQNVTKVRCQFCDTTQERPFSSVYQYYLGTRPRIPCTDKRCNTYRKNYKQAMSYDRYIELMDHGCRACGMEVSSPRDLCPRCQRIINRIGGEPAFADFLRTVMAHTEDFTVMWEGED
jgi:hypothetical protein